MQKYTYLKDGETVASERLLHSVAKPSHLVSALDLSGLSEEEATKAARLYDQWLLEVKKPYDVLEREFRANNLTSFETFCRENGVEQPPMIKSFKASGLIRA